MKQYALILSIVGLLALQGCKTAQYTTQYQDSVRIEYHYDSIYIWQHDSIYVEKETRNDTVYLTTEKWQTKWRDKIVIQHDTVTVANNATIVEEVKYIPNFYKTCTWLFWIIVVLVLIYIVIKVLKKIYLK